MSAVRLSQLNFKARLDYSKVKHNASKWAEVANEFSKVTEKQDSFVLELDEVNNSVVVNQIKRKNKREKLDEFFYSNRGGIQEILVDGKKKAAKALKNILSKAAKEEPTESYLDSSVKVAKNKSVNKNFDDMENIEQYGSLVKGSEFKNAKVKKMKL